MRGYREDEKTKFERLLRPISRESSILDIGCGFGRKLYLLNKLGFTKITGVDKNFRIVEFCRKKRL